MLDRTNTSMLGRWWWTVDRVQLALLLVVVCAGFILISAGSPPVAQRLNLPPFYFVHRHQIFLAMGMAVMLALSMLSPRNIRRISAVGLVCSLVLMALVPFFGTETKGAHRWINLMGISVQPSEFMKPCFAVMTAWVLSLMHKRMYFPGNQIAIAMYIVVVALLALQPDFGMTLTVTAAWGIQFFLAGLPMFWMLVMAGFGGAGMVGAYHFFPHVAKRIDRFLDPASGDNYQVAKSLEAFENGGIFGRGPGEGEIKQFIPDSHTDFVFAVVGEEFGMIVCVLIVALYAAVVLRGLSRIWRDTDWFMVIAVAGLLAQFGIQAVINMGVAVNILPAKGMTLPFISYGGSSVIAIAMGMGMMLALTRRRFGPQKS